MNQGLLPKLSAMISPAGISTGYDFEAISAGLCRSPLTSGSRLVTLNVGQFSGGKS